MAFVATGMERDGSGQDYRGVTTRSGVNQNEHLVKKTLIILVF